MMKKFHYNFLTRFDLILIKKLFVKFLKKPSFLLVFSPNGVIYIVNSLVHAFMLLKN